MSEEIPRRLQPSASYSFTMRLRMPQHGSTFAGVAHAIAETDAMLGATATSMDAGLNKNVGIAIRTPDELESKLAQALADKERLVFVDVTVDETEHVYPMQIRGGSMDEMWLSKTERTWSCAVFYLSCWKTNPAPCRA